MEDDWLEDFEPKQGGASDPLTSREYDRIASRYSDAGYREGITDGKLSTLQEGFDQSFANSVPPSRRLGNLRGRAAAILAFYSSSTSPEGDKLKMVERLRGIIGELGKVRRDDILPRDLEREEHEREEHEEHGFELEVNEKREMEGLEQALEGFGTSTKGDGNMAVREKREGELLDDLERRLSEVEMDLRGSY